MLSEKKAQTAVEYLLVIGMGVVFVTIVAYFVKTAANR
jgi:uncharacterized protein (UPF0333 family)